jgi:undecaprenyl-phosphate 4-deoxy-4-formamido-L-arabinose transferase
MDSINKLEQIKYSIVVPCYKSSSTIKKLVVMTMEELSGNKIEFILVNDCSPDGGETVRCLKNLAQEYSNVTAIDLAKNVGQHNALLAALNYTKGDYIISMDDDMQTHPSQIHKLIEEINKGYDVVYAYYPQKKHSWYRNIGSAFNSWSVRIMIGKPKNLKTSSFWIAKRFVRDYIVQYRNSYAFMQGLILRTTQNIQCIPVEHFDREVGTSGYTLKSLIKLWSNIIGFSVMPLRIASGIGVIFATIGITGTLIILIKKLLFHSTAVGWTSIMMAICFFSGIILLFMGLIGEYIGRMFLASNNQPQYVVREVFKQCEED